MSLFPKVGRNQPGVRLVYWLVVVFLCLGVFLHLLPFYFMISSSLKSGAETVANPPSLWPQHPSFDAWTLVFRIATGISYLNSDSFDLMPEPFYIYLRNSLFMTIMTLVFSLPVTAFAAYANSKLQRGPGARWTFLYFICMLMVPNVVILLPSFLLTLHFPFAFPTVPTDADGNPFPSISIFDTPWAVVIPNIFNAFNFLLFKGFFDTIPNSILQAARVDGGSELNIFRRLVLPMSVPVFAVAAWLQFGAIWDGSFLWASLVFRSNDQLPTSVAIYNLITMLQQQGTMTPASAKAQELLLKQGLTWNGLMVLGLLQTIPVFIVFLICREYLLKGIRLRGLR